MWCENSLEESRRLSKKTLYCVVLHTQRSTEKEEYYKLRERGGKIQFLVKINKLKDGTKNRVEAAVEPEKKYCLITGT